MVFIALFAALYTGYKAFGQAIDDRQHDWTVVGSVLPRTDIATEAVANLEAAGYDVFGNDFARRTIEVAEGGN